MTSQLVDRAKYHFVIIKYALKARQKGKLTELIQYNPCQYLKAEEVISTANAHAKREMISKTSNVSFKNVSLFSENVEHITAAFPNVHTLSRDFFPILHEKLFFMPKAL